MIECSCTAGVMARDGCAENNAAAAVTASAVILTRVFNSNSLQKTSEKPGLPWRLGTVSDGTLSVVSLISISRAKI
jgi:hypothetical protein